MQSSCQTVGVWKGAGSCVSVSEERRGHGRDHPARNRPGERDDKRRVNCDAGGSKGGWGGEGKIFPDYNYLGLISLIKIKQRFDLRGAFQRFLK